MAIKIYRAVYRGGDGETFFSRSNLNFHRWVVASDMEAARVELNTVVNSGTPPTIIGWEEMELEADEVE